LLFAPHCKKKLKAYSKEKKKKKKKLKELEKRISAAVAGVATPVRAWLCRCVQCVVVSLWLASYSRSQCIVRCNAVTLSRSPC
jgi:hypothetical protein